MESTLWAEFLSSTARLVDLYDMQRQESREDVQALSDQKRHNSSGIWFAVAVNILEYLQYQDSCVPGRYVSREGVYQSIFENKTLSGILITHADIDSCIRSLSTPFELNFKFLGASVKKIGTTALIQEASSKKRLRLSPRGKITCQLAYGIPTKNQRPFRAPEDLFLGRPGFGGA